MPYRSMHLRQFMTRLVTLMTLLVGACWLSAPAALAAGADIYGVGGGSSNFAGTVAFAKFAFSGHTGPNGDFGSFRYIIEDPTNPLDVHVDVDCVNVFPLSPDNGGGWIGGAVTKVTPQPNVFLINEGDRLLLGFNDFGEPSDLIADELNLYFEFASCKMLGPSTHNPIDQGNIVVKFE
jgi:hypothetical protein